MARTLAEAVELLRRDPSQPVRAQVDGLMVEVRAVEALPGGRSAAEIFAALGPWEGETTEEILGLLDDARRVGGQRNVPSL